MKFLFSSLLLVLVLPFLVKSQNLKVINQKSEPVSQAVIAFKNLETKTSEVFLTDNNGILKLPIYSKFQLFITHVSYKDYIDTIYDVKGDITIKLLEKNVPLTEIVVTSQYAPSSITESVDKVTVITKEQIANQSISTLDEALAHLLNVRINQDQLLGSGVTINGLSGQNIKYLVDGVPVIGRLDGNIDIGQINLNNIERIELVQGPMAAAFGTDAAGGVINLISRHTSIHKYQTGVNLLYNNIGQYNADFYSGINSGNSSIILSGGRNFFDGWSAADTGRWQEWKPKEQYFGNLKYSWSGKKLIVGYQLSVFNEKISNKGTPRISPYFAYAFDEYYKTQRFTNQVTLAYIFNRDLHLNSSFSWSYYNRNKNTYRKDLVALTESLIPGSLEQDTTKMNSYVSRSVISSGKTGAIFTYEAGYDITVENAKGTRFNNTVKYSGDYAAFASFNYKASEKLNVKPALRLSYNTTYKAPVVPSISFKYDFTSLLQGRLSYGKGFRAPGLKERYLYFVDVNHNIRGNENLLPEYSDNFFGSLNYSYTISKVHSSVELNGFYNDIRNMITLAQPDPASSLYTYINLGTFSTHGAALTENLQWRKLSASAGAAYTGRYNIYSDSGAFKKFIYSPDLNAMVQYVFNKINLTASVYFKYNGKLPGYKLNADNTISQFSNDSYRFLDATIRKAFFNKTLFVAAGVKNIMNVTSINAFSENSAHSSGSGEQSIGTGRSYFIKLQYMIVK